MFYHLTLALTLTYNVTEKEYNIVKRGKVSVTYVRTSVTVVVASSVANDVTVRVTS